MEVQTHWAETIRLLKSLGFVHNSADIEYPAYDIACYDDEIVMVEQKFSRNRLAIVLCDDHSYDVYVQEDAGCGWVELPFRWSDIETEWLTNLKKAFEGHGFNS